MMTASLGIGRGPTRAGDMVPEGGMRAGDRDCPAASASREQTRHRDPAASRVAEASTD